MKGRFWFSSTPPRSSATILPSAPRTGVVASMTRARSSTLRVVGTALRVGISGMWMRGARCGASASSSAGSSRARLAWSVLTRAWIAAAPCAGARISVDGTAEGSQSAVMSRPSSW